MRSWIKQNQIRVIVNSAVLLCIAIAWILYSLIGHQIIEAMYNGESIKFLNSIIDGQSIHPLAHYLQAADTVMWIISLLMVALSSVLTLLMTQRHGHAERLVRSWGVLVATAVLILMYGPFLLAHFRNSANPLLFNDDARPWVVPFVVPGLAS